MAFSRTARLGSFAAAARELGCAPSTLAKRVARLEEALGVKLFHRTTRQVSLTPDGEHLFRRCERVLSEVDELQAEAAGSRGTVSGTLRLDAPLTYGRRVLMPALARLLHVHPALGLDLRLRAHAAIVFRMPSSGRDRTWQLMGPQGPLECLPRAQVQVNDGEGMVAAAVAGLGITQVPDNMVPGELESGALVELLPECRPPAMPISIVMPSARLMPPRVRALIALLEGLHSH
ncbi:LysR family transcriptional regulator [Aquabacterium sp.]|uniref:LysR family transcriptional regulator n=1 Tax=Aquabacterium sp. TaxID=1872578 RepID=UPI0035C68A44